MYIQSNLKKKEKKREEIKGITPVDEGFLEIYRNI
jgi:hypothetical protein